MVPLKPELFLLDAVSGEMLKGAVAPLLLQGGGGGLQVEKRVAGLQEVENGCAGAGPFSTVMASWYPERAILKDVKDLGLKELGDFIKHV